MSTLLGFLDSKIKDEYTGEPWKTSKIGGHLCLPLKENELNDLKRLSTCDKCNVMMIFIGQICCPLEIDNYDRYLIVFACNTVKCGQWSVIRYIQDASDRPTVECSSNRKEELKFEESNWLNDQDDWNDDAVNEGTNNVESIGEDNATDRTETKPFTVFNEDANEFIQPYYLAVDLESQTEASVKLDDHVNDLLKNYKEKNADSKSQSGTDEYSRIDETDILENYNNDVQTYRFYKKLSLVAGQVIRYGWNQSPLLNSSNVKLDETLSCANCGSIKVFEFQLMPALINYLRLRTNNEPLNVDFATVLVFTCKQNCSVKMLTRESFMVLEENDQHIPEHLLTNN